MTDHYHEQREYDRKDNAMLGKSKYERREGDFYETPAWCTEALIASVRLPGVIWEPAAGRGAIVAPLVAAGHKVYASDIEVRDGFELMVSDFLASRRSHRDADAIVTNPPYTLAREFIEHALGLMEPVGGVVAMLLRNEYDSAKTRQHLFGGHPAFARKLTLTKRPQWIEGELRASPRHNYSWFIWDWRHEGAPTLSYGPKEKDK